MDLRKNIIIIYFFLNINILVYFHHCCPSLFIPPVRESHVAYKVPSNLEGEMY